MYGSGPGSGSGSFPFRIKVFSGLKKCVQNIIFTQTFSKKWKFLRLKIICLRVSYKKQIWKNFFFLASLKSLKKGVGSESGPFSQRYTCADPDPHQNVSDPQHRLYELRYVRRFSKQMREQIPLLRESIKAASMTDLKASPMWHYSYFIYFYINRADIGHCLYILLVEYGTLLLSSWLPLGRGPPLGCLAKIRTRACFTASRRATVWATQHPVWATPHPSLSHAAS